MMLGRYRRMACYVFLGFILGVALERFCSKFSRRMLHDIPEALARTKSPSVTCLVIVRNNHFRNLKASQQTWLSKCDHHIIVKQEKIKKAYNMFATEASCQQPPEVYSVTAKSGWDFLCTSLLLLPQPIEWLIIVPDSVLVIMESLKRVIENKDWRKYYYMGHPIQHYKGSYNVLSAGIVLSNGTLETLFGRFPDKPACRVSGKYWNNEDVYLGMHLSQLDIFVEDTRDEDGRTRFNGYNANTLLFPGKIYRQTDYYKKALYPSKDEKQCCSDSLVTIDCSDAELMYVHYFFIYGTWGRSVPRRPIQFNLDAVVTSKPQWVQALRDIGYLGDTDNISNEEYYRIWEKHISPEKLMKQLKDTADVQE